MNFKTFFNKNRKDKCFNSKEKQIKDYFKNSLEIIKMLLNDGLLNENHPNYNESYMRSVVYRLVMGYNGTSYGSGITSGAYTVAWKKEKDKNKAYKGTCDHVAGATAIGEYVTKVFIENDLNVEYMVKKWLPENLYLWATVKVTTEEHKGCNILQNPDMTMEEKFEFKHYVNTSDVVFPVKDINKDKKTHAAIKVEYV